MPRLQSGPELQSRSLMACGKQSARLNSLLSSGNHPQRQAQAPKYACQAASASTGRLCVPLHQCHKTMSLLTLLVLMSQLGPWCTCQTNVMWRGVREPAPG